jgi:hypothetical protein
MKRLNRSFFLSPFFNEPEKKEIIQKFLDEKLTVPRDRFGPEVVPLINEFTYTNFPDVRTQIYLDNSGEVPGFEVFLDELPFEVGKGKPLMRIRVFFNE